MDHTYFRSYIRQYACSAEEIQKAFKHSNNATREEIDAILSDNSIEKDFHDSTEASTTIAYPISQGEEVFIGKPCPPERASTYCYNGGTCYVEYFAGSQAIEFCKCPPGWEGRQCQHMYNPMLYESARVGTEVESAAVGSLIAVIVIGLIIFSGIIYLSKMFCKGHDLREYMYSESTVDPESLTPVRMYPFSRRTPISFDAAYTSTSPRKTTSHNMDFRNIEIMQSASFSYI